MAVTAPDEVESRIVPPLRPAKPPTMLFAPTLAMADELEFSMRPSFFATRPPATTPVCDPPATVPLRI